MMLFILCATLMVAVICAFLFLPLWFGRRGAALGGDRQTANLAIFRDQLADLERECREGTLAEADFDQARQELQRRLLEEAAPAAESGVGEALAPSRKTAIALILLLPLGALIGYSLLGNPAALDPARTAAQTPMSPEQIDGLVARLAERMQSNPDDMQGWLMLARSYKALGRYDDAVDAYAKAETVIDKEPDLLSSYAETIAMSKGQRLAGKPRELVERALKIDPRHAHSLFLAGAAAIEAKDNAQGIAYWEALLPQVEPGSELDQMLRAGIEQLKQGK